MKCRQTHDPEGQVGVRDRVTSKYDSVEEGDVGQLQGERKEIERQCDSRIRPPILDPLTRLLPSIPLSSKQTVPEHKSLPLPPVDLLSVTHGLNEPALDVKVLTSSSLALSRIEFLVLVRKVVDGLVYQSEFLVSNIKVKE